MEGNRKAGVANRVRLSSLCIGTDLGPVGLRCEDKYRRAAMKSR
jgi:hypothetical protein